MVYRNAAAAAIFAMMLPAAALAAPTTWTLPDSTTIDGIVATIGSAEIVGYDQHLQGFGTRYSNEQGGSDAQAWLQSQFASYGYAAANITTIDVSGVTAKDVCATLPGSVDNTLYILGAHYDSITADPTNAPGSDDNGSGTSGMLAIAHALAGHTFKSTIVLCGYAGEELGLYGSRAQAGALAASGADVGAMVNMDMIGYLDPGDTMDVDVVDNANSATLRQFYSQAATRYTPEVVQVDGQLPPGASSDHASFWSKGWPAIMLFEDSGNYTPYLHTANDVYGLSFNSPTLATWTTRSAAAVIASLAVPDDGSIVTPTPKHDDGDGALADGVGCETAGAGRRAASPFATAGLALVGLSAALVRRR